VANFKEAQTSRMAEGQAATLRVDALADAELKGRVERIAPATGSEFSVIRADNATGNFTKIPQRLPVRISVDMREPLAERLRPGMSVIARVDTRKAEP
jgi:multidrug resistance efflux pump